MTKVMLIGWDAADWRVIRPLLDAGQMPNLQRLMDRGSAGNLATLSPAFSPMLWTSIATGKRPYRHGILGFAEPTADRSAVQPITNLSRRCKAVWNILNQTGKRSIVVGWWPSHPAEPINGVMVSNQYHRATDGPPETWKMPPGAVHPEHLAADLADLRFHPTELTGEDMVFFVPDGAQIDQKADQRLLSCARIVADATTVQAAATHLLETEDWDFAAVYFDAIDHFCHGFMRYHPPKRADVSQQDFDMYKDVVAAGYRFHDAMLGTLLDNADDDTTVLLISDHGFHPDDLRPTLLPTEPAGPAAEHRDFGIFVMAGPGVRQGAEVRGASVLDIAPTILSAFGLAVGQDMDGRALVDVFSAPDLPEPVASWDDIPGDDGQHPAGARLDGETAQQMLKQLADLGYIDGDTAQNVELTERELSYNLGLAYMDGNLHGPAAEQLAALYTKAPLEFRFGIRLALCYQALGQIDAAERVVTHLNETWRVAAQMAKDRLQAFAASRKGPDPEGPATDEAKPPTPEESAVIRQLRGIARGNSDTLDTLFAGIATARRDHEAALRHLEKVGARTAKRPGLHVQTGNALLELGRLDEARAAYRAALDLDSDHAVARLGLARVALGEKDAATALAHADASLALKFQNPAAHYIKALALIMGGRPAEAAECLHQALAFNPNFPEAHERLSRIYARALEDKSVAITHRALARTLRRQGAANTATAPALDLPTFEPAQIEALLPRFPDPVRRLPPLGAPRGERGDTPDTGPAGGPGGGAAGAPAAIIVAGLPRSGTSLAMQMLRAGGVPVLEDGQREADANNPKGYVEYDPVRSLPRDNGWLDAARGKAVKVVTPLVPFLPQACAYKVILMDRPVREVVASQSSMLDRLDRDGAALDAERMAEVLGQQQGGVAAMLAAHGVPVLRLAYHDVLSDARTAARLIAAFLGQPLDIDAMAAQVDPSLYRERVASAAT